MTTNPFRGAILYFGSPEAFQRHWRKCFLEEMELDEREMISNAGSLG